MVFAVHAVKPEAICATEVLFDDRDRAEEYAASVSTDPGVLAGVVTEFVLNSPGRRRSVAMFVKSERQAVPHLSDDRTIAANGYLTPKSMRTFERRM